MFRKSCGMAKAKKGTTKCVNYQGHGDGNPREDGGTGNVALRVQRLPFLSCGLEQASLCTAWVSSEHRPVAPPP